MFEEFTTSPSSYDDPVTAPLDSIEVRGFRSIAELTLPLSSPVTLLVGANGSGKSNLIATFELLGRTVDGSFQRELLRSGGLAAQLHRSPTGDDASEVGITVWGQSVQDWQGEHIKNGYSVIVEAAHKDSALLTETTYTHRVDQFATPFTRQLPAGRESHLVDAAEEHAANRYVLDVLTNGSCARSGPSPPSSTTSSCNRCTTPSSCGGGSRGWTGSSPDRRSARGP